jgi:hypothetical protein
MAGRVLFVAPGLAAGDAGLSSLADAVRAEGVEVERLAAPETENALRARLAAGDVRLVLVVGSGQARQANHMTIDLASSAGPEPRAVNLRHLAGMFAAASGLQGVVLVPAQAPVGLARNVFAGFAERLVAHGAPAAMVWPGGLDVARGRRWFRAWHAGTGWPTLAALEWTELENAARTAGTSNAVPPRALVPVSPAATPPRPLPEPAAPTPAERLLEAKRAEGRFDVFLCHNSADKPAVRVVARALRARGVLPWLDEWELPPGQPWQPLLERQIENIRSAAVFVGLAGVGPWQEQEIYGFLREFVARRAPVIPVLLDNAPSAPDLPVFLRAMTYVDFRQREPDPMVRLEWGVTGVRPDYA